MNRCRRIYEVNDRDSGPWPGQQVQTLKSFSLLHKNKWKSLDLFIFFKWQITNSACNRKKFTFYCHFSGNVSYTRTSTENK